MAFKIPSAVRETTITVGTGDLLLAGAVDASCWAFGGKLADGDTTLVTVKKVPNREVFVGTYNAGPNTISRTRMLISTNGGAAVSWGNGTKEIFVAQVGLSDLDATAKAAFLALLNASTDFASATTMTFQQATAPVGWVKQVTHDDKALRVVSGTPGSGGSSPFSTVFAKTTVDAHTLTAAEQASMSFSGTTGNDSPDHSHNIPAGLAAGAGGIYTPTVGVTGVVTTNGANQRHQHSFSGTANGGGGSHAHGMDIRVQYVDLILATKT